MFQLFKRDLTIVV